MIRIRLPEAEAQRLERAYREEIDPKYRDRIQIVRLASRDRPHKDIAADLAVTPRTVQRWLNAYLDAGLDGLRPRKAPGKPGNIPPEMADELKRWVIGGPAKQGLDRANWTHEELADHLLKARGIRTSRSAVCLKAAALIGHPCISERLRPGQNGITSCRVTPHASSARRPHFGISSGPACQTSIGSVAFRRRRRRTTT